jgi:hypothetical protein
MNKQNYQTIQISVVHSALLALLTRFLKMQRESSNICTDDSILEEIDLCDFGVRFKVLLLQTNYGTRTELQVLIPGWQDIQADAIDRLRSIYGESVRYPSGAQSSQNSNFVIHLDEAVKNFDSIESCATSLAQIRIQAAGAPFLKALERIVSEDSGPRVAKEEVHRLTTHPRCGTCHCLSTAEK